MSKIWKKARFARGRRKYFGAFPCNCQTSGAMMLYFNEAYHLPFSQEFKDGWFICLNKTIYRIARTLLIEPSQVTADVIRDWFHRVKKD